MLLVCLFCSATALGVGAGRLCVRSNPAPGEHQTGTWLLQHHGTPMETHGTCMGHLWDTHGTPVGHPWKPMGHQWDICGTPIETHSTLGAGHSNTVKPFGFPAPTEKTQD